MHKACAAVHCGTADSVFLIYKRHRGLWQSRWFQMACTMKQCVAAVLLLAVAAQAVHLDFAGGLNGWQHSDDDKYAGKFELATPEGLSSQALKVSGPEAAMW